MFIILGAVWVVDGQGKRKQLTVGTRFTHSESSVLRRQSWDALMAIHREFAVVERHLEVWFLPYLTLHPSQLL